MSTKVTDLTELAVTPNSTDVLHIVDVSDISGGSAGTSKKIQVSNLLASAGSVDSVNGQTGVVVLEMNDIDDVNAAAPADNIVLSYDTATSKYIADTRLTTLYTEFRNGTAVNVYADGTTATQGRIELTATGANLKTGVTGITVTETSPGDIDFTVATDATGSTTFTALHLDGTTVANEANLIVKLGCFLAIEGTGNAQAKFRSTNSGNTLLNVPASSGTLALTSDIPAAGVSSVTGAAPITSTGGTTPVIGITAATTSAAGSMSAADKTSLNNLTAAYEEDELVTGQNTLMNSSVSVASNKVVDIMGDALADTSNANSKKFLGFHTGSGVCVLQGMVDAVASISGATAGGALWIGASGSFSATAPTTANYYSRVVGHYIGTGQGGEELVYFNPSQDWVQIS
jgi:hypothetical protein